MGKRGIMSKTSTYTSRKGIVKCQEKDLYNFLTDMRNFKSLIPDGTVTEWQASHGLCSFKIDRLGKVSVELLEAMPYSLVSYEGGSFFTGKVMLSVNFKNISDDKAEISLSIDLNNNPLIKMVIGDSAERYLESLISAIEDFKGYDKIRGYTQSP